ncbi:hypothetical protein EVAR_59439_1 [Eumeta japonica]|uniref:Uncharacterized protein n=1 Tax=Eumeta variegata TaxID=151549 RepID=A0A4C1Z488_EUMVA|nr:hypothetical protein EVAR_59439_1 [Eumeta japonica]
MGARPADFTSGGDEIRLKCTTFVTVSNMCRYCLTKRNNLCIGRGGNEGGRQMAAEGGRGRCASAVVRPRSSNVGLRTHHVVQRVQRPNLDNFHDQPCGLCFEGHAEPSANLSPHSSPRIWIFTFDF